jgi:superfamily I DNA/RNA helicase
MAYDLLLRNPEYLNKVRSKLHHVILDEYQDVSVAQHKLLKLLIRGVIESSSEGTHSKSHVPVLLDHKRTKLRTSETVCLNVPKCFCAGDVNQSIYGWRGAAPLLTVDGFRKDFPQGLVIPLQMNYRLPRQILNAADILLGREDTDFSSSKHVTAHSSDISPSAAKSASTMVTECLSDTNKVDHHVDQLLKESILNESRCSVFIKGLWDIREEAKYIASKILSRSNERVSSLEKTLKKHSNGICKESKNFLFDSTDVAIMLRSSKHMKLFEEALRSYRIPYTKSNDSSSNTRKDQRLGVTHKPKSRAIKPVKLITMHGGKGDEFDDVYLAGWTEGVFPQKSAMQSNRLHEERRIAYVALTRARQSVLLTYSFVNRIPYFGPLGERKEVTEQAEPSRFLHDLMPKEKNSSNGIKSHEVEWCNKIGFKEVVAGQNLPDHFSKAYRVPVGYKTRDLFKGTPLKKESMPSDESCQSNTLDKVYTGLRSINDGERGSCKKYRIIFREILKEIGITKGSAIVFKDKMKAETKAMDALVDAHTDDVMSRALSRCTAKELGLYIVYLLFKNK